MKTYEFTLFIDDQHVTGRYGVHGVEPPMVGRAELDLDPFALKTIGLMNRWLSLWDMIESSEMRLKKALLEPSTLDVLGTHLWRLILENEVGEELRTKIPAEGEPPLRLSIEFGDKADATLKGLPWEFLYEPVNGWYLATKTELLLTRYVTTAATPATVAQATEKETLHALLIASVPRARGYGDYREALGDLRTALNDVSNLEVPPPIRDWDQDLIRKELESQPYHIIHVVGICTGTSGRPKIYLGGDGDGFHDPAPFIATLTANPRRPRLVILQLCDFLDGDATENFERIAPDLIKRGVTAVLALQYAGGPQADTIGLGKKFYRSLVEGKHIGVAVQASRKSLMDTRRDRRFGTPVLYLQEDVALRRTQPQAGTVTASTTTTKSETSAGPSIRKALLKVLGEAAELDDAAERDLLKWVSELDSGAGPDEVTKAVREKLRTPLLDIGSANVYAEMIVVLGKLGEES